VREKPAADRCDGRLGCPWTASTLWKRRARSSPWQIEQEAGRRLKPDGQSVSRSRDGVGSGEDEERPGDASSRDKGKERARLTAFSAAESGRRGDDRRQRRVLSPRRWMDGGDARRHGGRESRRQDGRAAYWRQMKHREEVRRSRHALCKRRGLSYVIRYNS